MNFAYTSQPIDRVSHAYALGNGYRHYLPWVARFATPDQLSPFGAGGPNPYSYCTGDPINRSDPSGHTSIWGIISDVLVDTALTADIGIDIATGNIFGMALGSTALATTISSQVSEAKRNRKAALWFGMASIATSMPEIVHAGRTVGAMSSLERSGETASKAASSSESILAREQTAARIGGASDKNSEVTSEPAGSVRRQNSIDADNERSLAKQDRSSTRIVGSSSKQSRLANMVSVAALGENIAGGIFSSIDALTQEPQTVASVADLSRMPSYNQDYQSGYNSYSVIRYVPYYRGGSNPCAPFSSYYASPLAGNV